MSRTLSEPESKALLGAYGIPCVDDRVVTDAATAVHAAEQLGLPVVLKLAGAAIAHKTERGLVRLGLATPDDVAAAADELFAAARPEDGDVAVLVAPMVQGLRELIVGMHRDGQFGACVMVGLGGVLAEALADVSWRLAPIEHVDAEEMLDDLAGRTLLDELRGEPPVDRRAVASVLVALSRMAADRDDVVSIDVNPLIIDRAGAPVAVDALVEVVS